MGMLGGGDQLEQIGEWRQALKIVPCLLPCSLTDFHSHCEVGSCSVTCSHSCDALSHIRPNGANEPWAETMREIQSFIS